MKVSEFDKLAENGGDVLKHFDMSTAVRLGDKQSALAQRIRRAAQSAPVQKAKASKPKTHQHAFSG